MTQVPAAAVEVQDHGSGSKFMDIPTCGCWICRSSVEGSSPAFISWLGSQCSGKGHIPAFSCQQYQLGRLSSVCGLFISPALGCSFPPRVWKPHKKCTFPPPVIFCDVFPVCYFRNICCWNWALLVRKCNSCAWLLSFLWKRHSGFPKTQRCGI